MSAPEIPAASGAKKIIVVDPALFASSSRSRRSTSRHRLSSGPAGTTISRATTAKSRPSMTVTPVSPKAMRQKLLERIRDHRRQKHVLSSSSGTSSSASMSMGAASSGGGRGTSMLESSFEFLQAMASKPAPPPAVLPLVPEVAAQPTARPTVALAPRPPTTPTAAPTDAWPFDEKFGDDDEIVCRPRPTAAMTVPTAPPPTVAAAVAPSRPVAARNSVPAPAPAPAPTPALTPSTLPPPPPPARPEPERDFLTVAPTVAPTAPPTASAAAMHGGAQAAAPPAVQPAVPPVTAKPPRPAVRRKPRMARTRHVATRHITRRTTRRTYRVGKLSDKPVVNLLLKSSQARREVNTAMQAMHTLDLSDIRLQLRKRRLLRDGSTAPAEMIRAMYEAAMLAGDITNKTVDIAWLDAVQPE